MKPAGEERTHLGNMNAVLLRDLFVSAGQFHDIRQSATYKLAVGGGSSGSLEETQPPAHSTLYVSSWVTLSFLVNLISPTTKLRYLNVVYYSFQLNKRSMRESVNVFDRSENIVFQRLNAN